MSDKNSELEHVQSIANAMRSIMDSAGDANPPRADETDPLHDDVIKPLSTLQMAPMAQSDGESAAQGGGQTPRNREKLEPKATKTPDKKSKKQTAQKSTPTKSATAKAAEPKSSAQELPAKKEVGKGRNQKQASAPQASPRTPSEANSESVSKGSSKTKSKTQSHSVVPPASASPLSRLSLQLGRALADIRRGTTLPSSEPISHGVPPQIETLSAALEARLFALEDEAERSRTAILEELSRFDSAQRRILGEAEKLMSEFQHHAEGWLKQEKESLAQKQLTIASKEELFRKIIGEENSS